MPRSALSQIEVDEFRDALCENATRLFAEQGYEGVTMRALATSLGCSAMTPYRYFENKSEIFDAVRSAAADRFADALEDEIRLPMSQPMSHAGKFRALTRAYVRFALDEPHAYRIIFELDGGAKTNAANKEELRSWLVMYSAVEDAIRDGALEGDPEIVSHLLWSGIHGIVALHLAGKLVLGLSLEKLVEAFTQRELSRLNAQPIPAPSA